MPCCDRDSSQRRRYRQVLAKFAAGVVRVAEAVVPCNVYLVSDGAGLLLKVDLVRAVVTCAGQGVSYVKMA